MTKCKECVCADCVRNEFICLNTPHPCDCADCDICPHGEMSVFSCNHHLTIEMINAIIESEREVK